MSRRGALSAALAAALLLASASSAAAAAGDDVRIIAHERVEPRVVELTISTPAFAEPTKVDVDLPVGYDPNR